MGMENLGKNFEAKKFNGFEKGKPVLDSAFDGLNEKEMMRRQKIIKNNERK